MLNEGIFFCEILSSLTNHELFELYDVVVLLYPRQVKSYTVWVDRLCRNELKSTLRERNI